MQRTPSVVHSRSLPSLPFTAIPVSSKEIDSNVSQPLSGHVPSEMSKIQYFVKGARLSAHFSGSSSEDVLDRLSAQCALRRGGLASSGDPEWRVSLADSSDTA